MSEEPRLIFPDESEAGRRVRKAAALLANVVAAMGDVEDVNVILNALVNVAATIAAESRLGTEHARGLRFVADLLEDPNSHFYRKGGRA